MTWKEVDKQYKTGGNGRQFERHASVTNCFMPEFHNKAFGIELVMFFY